MLCSPFWRRTTDLTVLAAALLNVSQSLSVDGQVTFYHPTTLAIGESMTMESTATLLVYVTALPPVTLVTAKTGFFRVPIATFLARAGQFANVTVVMNYPVSRASACYVPKGANQEYSGSALTVVVDVQSCDSAESSGGLSTGAIVGIAVGAAVGGILIALLIVLLVRFFSFRFFSFSLHSQVHRATAQRTSAMNSELRGQALDQL